MEHNRPSLHTPLKKTSREIRFRYNCNEILGMEWGDYNILSPPRIIFIVFSPVQRWNFDVFYHYQQLPKNIFNWGAGVILAHHGDNYKNEIVVGRV